MCWRGSWCGVDKIAAPRGNVWECHVSHKVHVRACVSARVHVCVRVCACACVCVYVINENKHLFKDFCYLIRHTDNMQFYALISCI